jgi:EmrB/QacA subfamily drug resistance transporter
MQEADQALAYPSAGGRWLVAAAALGTGAAFLDGSVVNLALPAIGRDLGGGFAVQQWVVDGYLLTLGALLLLGGSLGDRYGRRRVFLLGLGLFSLASLAGGLAPDGPALIAFRLVQGMGGALLVPNSLALIESGIRPGDRGRAIGTWAGLSGVASAGGPFLGGWLIDTLSWRWVFFIVAPIAVLAAALALRHAPESRAAGAARLDVAGAACVTIGLGGVLYALIEVPDHGWDPAAAVGLGAAVATLLALPFVERRSRAPLIPPALLRSRQFVGANVVTFAVYAALSSALFLVALQLQQTLGWSALAAGSALLPMTAVMLLLSARTGALAQRVGPRWPMTVGALLAGAGLALLTRAVPGQDYVSGVLPGITVFGLGMSLVAAPLTGAVLAAVPPAHVGAAAGTNNAVSRIAGLLAVAVLPTLAGVHAADGAPLGPGFGRALWIGAGLCAVGAGIAALTVGRTARMRPTLLPGLDHPCPGPADHHDPSQEHR